jgi:hypothetical protein
LEHCVQSDAFVFNREVEAISPVGHTFTDFGTVVVVDNTVAIDVDKSYVTGYSSVAIESIVSVGFSLGLEDTVGFLAIEEREGLTVFGT